MPKTLDEHYGYLSDRVKVGNYRAAIGKIIRPEHTVLDLGCGTGLLDLLALRAGARVVPAAIDLELAPFEFADCRRFIGQSRDGSVPGGYEWLNESAANGKPAAGMKAEDLLTPPEKIASLEQGAEALDYQSRSAAFACTQNATVDGIGGWFVCRLAGDIRMTNSPLASKRLDRPQAFLPLTVPVPVQAGDTIKVTVTARHADNVIGWNVELPRSGERFSQTTFNGLLLDRDALTRANPDRIAALNERSRAPQIVLSCCDGKRTVAEVQALVERDYPALFPSRRAAVAVITQVLA